MVKIRKERILLKPEDIKPSSKKFEVLGVLNPGAVRLKDGRILLYVRVIEKLKKFEDSRYFYSPRMVGKKDFSLKLDKFSKKRVVDNGDVDFWFDDNTKRLAFISHLRRVYLDPAGFNILKVDKKPYFFGLKEDAELGVEDPRITEIDGKYAMTYVGLTRKENIATNLALSRDCLKWDRKGIIFGEQDKDTVIFPGKVRGRYVAFDRPEGNFEFSAPHIWVAYSKDLEYWGNLKCLKLSKNGQPTRFSRSGSGPPPIKTDKGWLLFFHAVTNLERKDLVSKLKRFFGKHVEPGPEVYAVWAALFDKDNPEKLISRSHIPIILPKAKDTKSFEGKMVVFPTGIVHDKNKKYVLLYSGFGDEMVGVQKIKLKDVFKKLEA